MKLRYKGSHTVTFLTGGIGEVNPGDEFEVQDEAAETFLNHPHVEEVQDRKPAKPRGKDPVKPSPSTEKKETQGAISDDR